MEKHKEKLGYAFFAALFVVSIVILTWTPGGPAAPETEKHTLGMSPFDKMRAGSEAEIEKNPIAGFANEEEHQPAPVNLKAKSLKKEDKVYNRGGGGCSQDARLLGECDGPPIRSEANSHSVKASPNVGALGVRPSGQPLDEPKKESQLDWLAEVTKGAKEKRIAGVVRTLPEGSIKAGCRFAGVIQDAIRVNSGFTNTITVNIRAPLGRCRLHTSSLKLKGTASMYNLETGFTGKIDSCSIPTSNLSSVPCQATVESVTGSDVLEGAIYDEEGWAIFFDALLATATAPFLVKIAETAASSSSFFASESAAIAGTAITRAVERVTAKINKKFEGREIRVPENAVVIITFDADTVL